MALNEDEVRSKLLAQLTPEERERGILYAASAAIPAGRFQAGMNEIEVPWEARLGFVDRDPGANWGHACRYIFLHIESDESFAVEGRFPPFQRNADLRWRTIYRAPSAPDWAVAIQEE